MPVSFIRSLTVPLLLLLSAPTPASAEASSSSRRWQAELLREAEEPGDVGCPAVAMVQVGSGAAASKKGLRREDSSSAAAAAVKAASEEELPSANASINASSAASTAKKLTAEVGSELSGQGRGLLLLEEQATVTRSSAPAMGILVFALGLVIVLLGLFTLLSAAGGDDAGKAVASLGRGRGAAKASGRPSLGPPASGFGSRAVLTPAPMQKDSISFGPTPRETLLPASGAPAEFAGMPVVCPELLMQSSVTRLALPVADLQDPFFEFDVLTAGAQPGVQVLTARAVSSAFDGRRQIELRLHRADKLLSVITPDLQILKAGGEVVGRLSKSSSAPMSSHIGGQQEHVLLNAVDEKVMAISSGPGLLETTMVGQPPDSESQGGVSKEQQQQQLAMVTRKPAGELPAEHYEATICQNIDSVLVLSCFLALAVFAQEPAGTMPATGLRSYGSAGDTIGLSSPTMTHPYKG